MTEDTSWLEGDQPDRAAVVPIHGATKRELAAALNRPIKAIDKLCREGLPARTTGTNRGGLRFDLPVVFEWLVTQAAGDDTDSMAQAKLRAVQAQTRLREIEAARLAGKLVEVDAIVADNHRTFSEIRAQIVTLPTLIPTLAPEQREQLEAEINVILSDISEKELQAEIFDKDESESWEF